MNAKWSGKQEEFSWNTHQQAKVRLISITSQKEWLSFAMILRVRERPILAKMLPLVCGHTTICTIVTFIFGIWCAYHRNCIPWTILRFFLTDSHVSVIVALSVSPSTLYNRSFQWRCSIFVFILQATQRWVILLEAVIHICVARVELLFC